MGQSSDGNVYRFRSRSDAEFVLHRLVGLRNGTVNKATHAAELRLSLILADLYTGGEMSRAEIVDANELVRVEKALVSVPDEDVVAFFTVTGMRHDDMGTVRRSFLAARSVVTSQSPEWTDDLSEARFFVSKEHAVNSAWWILKRGSIGYHSMGSVGDDLYAAMIEDQVRELPRMQLTDKGGNVASFCAFAVKTKSRTKTGIKRDISGQDDSYTSRTNAAEPEFARYLLKLRAAYVYLIVKFPNGRERRFKVEALSRREGVTPLKDGRSSMIRIVWVAHLPETSRSWASGMTFQMALQC